MIDDSLATETAGWWFAFFPVFSKPCLLICGHPQGQTAICLVFQDLRASVHRMRLVFGCMLGLCLQIVTKWMFHLTFFLH